MKKQKPQSGRARLPRGRTANERAKRGVKIKSALGTYDTGVSKQITPEVQRRMREAKLGPLQSLPFKDHCEMCGAKDDARRPNPLLEPAFNPSGKPMTLCQDCRIGSAESLADQRLSDSELATVLAALREWQRTLGPDNLPAQANAHTTFADFFNGWDGTLTPLSREEIDAMCERLNFPVTGIISRRTISTVRPARS